MADCCLSQGRRHRAAPSMQGSAVRVIVGIEDEAVLNDSLASSGASMTVGKRIYRRIWSRGEVLRASWFLLLPRWPSLVQIEDHEGSWQEDGMCPECCSGARRAGPCKVWDRRPFARGAFWTSMGGDMFCSSGVRAVLEWLPVRGLAFDDVHGVDGARVERASYLRALRVVGKMDVASRIERVDGCSTCGRDGWRWSPGDPVVCYREETLSELAVDAFWSWEEQGPSVCRGGPTRRRPSCPSLFISAQVRGALVRSKSTGGVQMVPVELLQ